MRYKRKCFIALILILMMIVSVSCKEVDKENTVSESTQETNKDGKSDGRESKDNNSKIKTPHILLEEINNRHYVDEDDFYSSTCRVQYTNLKLKDEGEEFEPLRKAFDAYNKSNDEYFEELYKTLERNSQEGDEEYREVGVDTYVMRVDKSMVSILNYEKADYGPGTVAYTPYSYNVDTKTGKVLDFTDVVKDEERFFELVDEVAKMDYEEAYDEPDIIMPSEYAQELEDYSDLVWTSNPEGVTLYFDEMDLETYGYGPQIITIYFDEEEDLFSEEYVNKEKDYVFPLINSDMYMRLDTDGDGDRDMVYVVNNYYAENESYEPYVTSVKVIRGVDEMEFEGFEGIPYVIKKDGKYYLYLFVSGMMSDAKVSYRINLETLENEDAFYWGDLAVDTIDGGHENGRDSFTHLEECFTDLDSVRMRTRFDVLSTIAGEKEWKIGEDAYPVSKEDRYKIISNDVLYTLKDVECEEVDEKGKVKGTAIIPADSYVLFIYSDGETFVDVRVVDEKDVEIHEWEGVSERGFSIKDESLLDYEGPCYRINVEYWPTEDGKYEDDYFEGISYAA